MNAFKINIDENRSVMGKSHCGGVLFQFANGAWVTRLALSYEAIAAMVKIAEAVKTVQEHRRETAKARRGAKKGGKGA